MTDKEQIKEKQKQLLELTGAFCIQKPDQEYLVLCEKLIRKMGRKRQVPFQKGKIEIWAAAVIQAIGSVNFLFDKSFEPYISAKQLNEYFKTNISTVSAKAKIIRDMFQMDLFNPDFSTSHRYQNNPLNHMVMVDGIIVPIDFLPEQMQQIVHQARAQGNDITFTTQSPDE